MSVGEEDWAGKSLEDILAFYNACSHAASVYDNAIWGVPSVALLIDGAMVTLAYSNIKDDTIRGIILLLPALWTFILLVVMSKHMFFVSRQKEKMTQIEAFVFKVPTLQRHSNPSKDQKSQFPAYAFKGWVRPNGMISQLSSHKMLKIGMWVLLLFMISLAIINFAGLETVKGVSPELVGIYDSPYQDGKLELRGDGRYYWGAYSGKWLVAGDRVILENYAQGGDIWVTIEENGLRDERGVIYKKIK